jgi:hypothetical protein
MIKRLYSAVVVRKDNPDVDVLTDTEGLVWIDGAKYTLDEAKELRMALDEAIWSLEKKAEPAAKARKS